MQLPTLSGFLEAIENYRYSIAFSLFILAWVPFIYPLDFESVETTLLFGIAFMFSMSISMIVVKDIWEPYIAPFFGKTFDVQKLKDERKDYNNE